jgi:molybdopterin-binding protein
MAQAGAPRQPASARSVTGSSPTGGGGQVRVSGKPKDREETHVKLSARNQLAGRVVEIRRGEAIANVVLDVAGQRLVASITVEAVEELGLAEGSSVTAVVKASDVMIATA